MRSGHWIMGIIVILAAVLCFVAAGCSKIENPAEMPQSISNPTDAVDETNEQDVQETTKEPNPEPVKEKEPLEVAFDVEVTGEKGKPVFVVKTNLPDGTEVGLYLMGDELYYEEQFSTVKNGKVESEPFTDEGAALDNYGVFGITMLPADQPEAVQAVIGAKGEFLSGPCVTDLGGYFVISFEKDFGEAQGEGAEKPEEKISEADMKAILESAMAAGFGENCSVYLDGVIFTASAWQDGMAMTALLAQGGNAEAAIAWDQVRTSTVAASKSLQEMLNNNGFSDYLAVVNILNDANRDNILLCVMAGMVVTDAAE